MGERAATADARVGLTTDAEKRRMMRRGVITGGELVRLAGPLEQGGKPVAVAAARSIRPIVDWGLAGFFFALAMLGVILPGLPTTPFLLLMCHFLIRVSPALHAKAMAWPVVGGPLRDWHQQQGVRPRVRVIACMMVLLLVGTTLWFGTLPLIVKVVIGLAAGCGLYIITRLPTARPESFASLSRASLTGCCNPNRL